MKPVRLVATAALSALWLTACGNPSEDAADVEAPNPPEADGETSSNGAAAVDEARLSNAASTPAEWLTYNGTYEEQRHSTLAGISAENISELAPTWTYELNTGRGIESTPIVVDGVMYLTSSWSVVYALDPVTGEELWVHDPEVDRAVGVKACCDVVNRGVAVYDGKVFVGVIDGRLQALDAETGEVEWSVVTVDQSKPYTITGAPRIVKGNVLIGNGGAELGVRGYLSAYDTETGDLDWRFYTVPNPNKEPDGAASDAIFAELANDTWGDDGAWVTDGGGGTVWDAIVYDEVNDQVIFGVGNGSPWNADIRDPNSDGDNLFVSSIVAVDATTGEYKWHYQTTPRDNWDYTATQHIMLADLPVGENGETRRVAMQAPKNGFFYVVDAETGELISGEPYAAINWAEGLDEDGRPIENPEARNNDPETYAGFVQVPAPYGAHNWHPMAMNPDLGLVYIPAMELGQAYITDPRFQSKPAKWNTGMDFSAGMPLRYPEGTVQALRAAAKGTLVAWDPVAQEARWTVEHGAGWNGGILSTASGIIFQGQLDGTFAAYDGATGEELWSDQLNSGALSGPMTYEVDGEQHVTITTGWGHAYGLAAGMLFKDAVPPALGKVITFKLGGEAEIPPLDTDLIVEPEPKAEPFGDEEMLEAGLIHYSRNCGVCHGLLGISSGVLPDLRWSTYTASADAWNNVVMNGALASNGMVSFSDVLTPEDSEAIRAYVVTQAHMNREGVSNQDIQEEAVGPGMDPDAEPELEADEQ
ncbi:PQQ-dependent dehydrogenase, methanol/ethanol family [Henriciella algicola]|uniref:PQQ-dependent dehydrogenase, methanol/ethanol family n=1 Tax=Henriciella algicola TaxID=1608422 RepID=A0A399RMM9_9PROT|nr:PQQ-dependent dehydrogenase, methanol/ethanol family [Henriciella algicola]RIJ31683.1 PQQ-dependent dehydrogenase, methanol/ethanol family [Henriciella algicola]